MINFRNLNVQPVVPFDLNDERVVIFDFSESNQELAAIDLHSTVTFTEHTFGLMEAEDTPVGLGKYNEDRIIYRQSNLFKKGEERSIHLGIDIWAEAGTPVTAPLNGKVHSLQNNNNFRDYGHTIILEHNVDGETLYTLYGHLSPPNVRIGQIIKAGEHFCDIGNFPENGDWPPHLHLQLMTALEGRSGDFPGVCSQSEREHFLNICPNPNLLLRVKKLP